MPAEPQYLDRALARFEGDLVVAVECIFTWYWIADFCEERGISFVLGHALYMKAIHGGKSKNDRIDSEKIASLLRAGMLPMAYVYPKRIVRPANREGIAERFEDPSVRRSIQADLDLLDIYHRLLLDLEAQDIRRFPKVGKAKALSIIAQKLGRTAQVAWASNERSEWPAYFRLKRKEPFDARRFFGDSVRELNA